MKLRRHFKPVRLPLLVVLAAALFDFLRCPTKLLPGSRSLSDAEAKANMVTFNEDQRKYLEMIQAVIARQAGNSFAIKGWAVTLIVVLGGLTAKDSDPRFSFMLWLPVLCFWGLDAFYLRQERLFRALYRAAVEGNAPLYAMDPSPFAGNVGSTISTAFSRTVLPLHLSIIVFVLALNFYSFHRAAAPVAEKPAATATQPAQPDAQASPSSAAASPSPEGSSKK